MNLRVDPFVGSKIELLTVLGRDEERSKPTALYYFCQCVCGKIASFRKQMLTSGTIFSCGCSKPPEKLKLEPGVKLGFWTLIEKDVDRSTAKNPYWRCRCECGVVRPVPAGALRNGMSRSCGCAKKSENRTVTSTLGRPVIPNRVYDEGTYSAWAAMKARCKATEGLAYEHYAARGITYCSEWESYDAFVRDMGVKPEGTSLDRIEVNKGYYPGNCRWATSKIQSNNKTNSRLYTNKEGVTKTIAEWAKEAGLNYMTLYARLCSDGDIDKALAPRTKGPGRPRKKVEVPPIAPQRVETSLTAWPFPASTVVKNSQNPGIR